MMKIKITLLLLSISLFSFAQNANDGLESLEISLDITQIQQVLKDAPVFDVKLKTKSNKKISVPTLSGEPAEFYVFETISMEEPLYSKFPQIRSYILINKDDPNYRGRLSTGPDQVHIMTKHNGQSEFIEPSSKKNKYNLYQGSNDRSNMTCGVEEIEQQIEESQNRSAQSSFSNGTILRTYRIAIATAGEFYNEFGGTTKNSTNDALVLAKINNYLNLLNDIFEDELAAHFNLIGNNTVIMFADPVNDNLDPANRVGSSQSVINGAIGAMGYDLGHTFYTIPPPAPPLAPCCYTSGIANLAILCEDNFKGGAWTGASGGASDDLFMGTFAHEIGHQFGAHHSMYGTTNNCSQRSPGHGYEPGSGNSLMSYEGTCGVQNITPEVATIYFHNHSLDEMITEMNAKSCHTSPTTSNSVPVTTAPINKTIPKGTPFELEGSATDADGDAIYFIWEEYDTDNTPLIIDMTTDNSALFAPNAAATSTTAPLFRSFDPSLDGNHRVFPKISDIIDNTQTQGEILPQVSRNMKFRLTSRDFNPAGGAVSCDEVDITVDDTVGPFDVTSQSTTTNWVANGANTATITWSVAGTSSICSNVDIIFSTDKGLSFPYTLVTNIPNNGSYVLTIPNLPTEIGRIKIRCSDNYFFDINEADITITSTCDAVAVSFSPDTDVTAIEGSSGLNLSLGADFGASISTFAGSIENSDPQSSLAVADNSGSCLNFNGNSVQYDMYTFQVSSSGTHTFSKPFGNGSGLVMNIYEGSYNPGSPCTNFVASSGTFSGGSVSISNSVSASLTSGIAYTFLVSSFDTNSPNLPSSYDITPSPTVFDGSPPPPTGFSYTYVAVNNATGNVAAINANSNFTALTPGTYTVHGLSYQTSNSITSYIGGSFSAFQTDVFNLIVCGAFSTNTITLTIQSSGNCPPNYAGGNALSVTETGVQDYETDGAIESTQIINASASVDYDSGTSITLDTPFEVKQGATFHAFIDGCAGAMLNENSEDEDNK